MLSSTEEVIDNFKVGSSSDSLEEKPALRRRFKDENQETLIKEGEDQKLVEAKEKLNVELSNESTDNDCFPIHNSNLFIIIIAVFFRLLVALHS